MPIFVEYFEIGRYLINQQVENSSFALPLRSLLAEAKSDNYYFEDCTLVFNDLQKDIFWIPMFDNDMPTAMAIVNAI